MGVRFIVAGVIETNICIRNNTNSSHQSTVADIDNYDWDGNTRPDKNFNNIAIEAGATICRREEVNAHAYQPSFTFIVDDTPTRIARKRTGYGDENDRWGAYTNKAAPLTLYGEKTIWQQSSEWWQGYTCDGIACSLFEIR